MLITNITQAIGRTPLLEIDPAVHGLKNVRLFAKLENLNPFGSLKDRPALNLLKDQLEKIKVRAANCHRIIQRQHGKSHAAACARCVEFRFASSPTKFR